MLNVLSGRVGGQGDVGGRVLYNGVEVEPQKFRSKIAYVMQEDALFATQTPTEVRGLTTSSLLVQYPVECSTL